MRDFRSPIEIFLLHRERQRQEQAARIVPYASFLLTHLALVLLLAAAFLVDPLMANFSRRLLIKCVLAGSGVIMLACEWAYAIVCSRRWKRTLQVLQETQERQEQTEEARRQQAMETVIVQERQQRQSLLMNQYWRRRNDYKSLPSSSEEVRTLPSLSSRLHNLREKGDSKPRP